MRVWLVKIDMQCFGDSVSYLPEWRATRREALDYLEDYRAKWTVDAPMSVVRYAPMQSHAAPKRGEGST